MSKTVIWPATDDTWTTATGGEDVVAEAAAVARHLARLIACINEYAGHLTPAAMRGPLAGLDYDGALKKLGTISTVDLVLAATNISKALDGKDWRELGTIASVDDAKRLWEKCRHYVGTIFPEWEDEVVLEWAPDEPDWGADTPAMVRETIDKKGRETASSNATAHLNESWGTW